MGLLGKKLGMTQLIMEDGSMVSVTVIDVHGNIVTDIRTQEKHGYDAVQIGFGEIKEKRVRKTEQGFFTKNNIEARKHMREFRDMNPTDYTVGMALTSDILPERISVSGVSKGKGFQGVMRRWNARGGVASHGSMHHRAPGSIGASSFPSRVIKGIHMPGHMGARNHTIENLKIVRKDSERHLIFVKGAVPGANGSLVYIYASPKNVK